jgi:plastocyanin
MPNSSGVAHNIAVQQGTSGPVLGASGFVSSGTTSVNVTLKPGTYTFFCQVPGHRQAGMEGTLTVK